MRTGIFFIRSVDRRLLKSRHNLIKRRSPGGLGPRYVPVRALEVGPGERGKGGGIRLSYFNLHGH